MSYSWPGNVRQLESAIERAILLCEGNEIEVEDLPVEIRQEGTSAAAFNFKLPPEGISFDEVERSLITQAMEQTNWNITRAAKLLGLSFRSLRYRLQKLVRRNKPVFAALATGVAALMVGFAIALYLFVRERAERRRAVAARGGRAGGGRS